MRSHSPLSCLAELPSARFFASPRRALPLVLLVLCALLIVSHSDDAISVHFRDLGYLTRPLWDAPDKPPFGTVLRLDRAAFAFGSPATRGSEAELSAASRRSRLCSAHGLRPLDATHPAPRVIDATIFSVELDLLELRLRELAGVVDTFLVAESRTTFAGLAKPLVLREALQRELLPLSHGTDSAGSADVRQRFAWLGDHAQGGRLAYREIGGLRPLKPDEDPFVNERVMRAGVSTAIEELMHAQTQEQLQQSKQGGDKAAAQRDTIVIMSDTDEIPSREAVELLKDCQWPPQTRRRLAAGAPLASASASTANSQLGEDGAVEAIVHLGMPTFLYSFEFPMERPRRLGMSAKFANQAHVSQSEPLASEGKAHGPRQWRATAKRYTQAQLASDTWTGFTHSRASDVILENAGWHCSFCFHYIEDFVFKMTSFSHNDRVTAPAEQLAPDAIQGKICTGRDVFDMLPEAYDFPALVRQLGPIRPASLDELTSSFGLPQFLLDNAGLMPYLLPGGCKREMRPS